MWDFTAIILSFPIGFLLGLATGRWVFNRPKRKQPPKPFKCTHNDSLCDKYGCPDDPEWKGDGCK